MGHCDSSAQLARQRKICGAGSGADAVAPERDLSSDGKRIELNSATRPVARLLLVLLRAYQSFLSPFYGGACKFYPSCSNYARAAVQRFGARRGTWLALKRLARCRPFSPGGYDPVPSAAERDL